MSSTIGVVLLVAFAIAGATTVAAIGGVALSDVEESAETDRVELAMTQFDSSAATVALGSSDTGRVRMGTSEAGRVSVEPDAGRVRLLVVNDTGSEEIANESLGAVVSETGATRTAYQGGGVWQRHADGSRMISPPEYHYRDQTLTFPIVRVTGGGTTGSTAGSLTITKNGSEQLFPTASRRNPLSDGHVVVEITSDYHRGWKGFFQTRMDGAVRHDPDNRTVAVNLTVPVTETFDNAVAATGGGDPIDESSTSPHGGFDSPKVTGVDRPSASPKVDERITDCESGGCADLSSELADDSLENGTYYEDGDVTLDETTYDTSAGDVHVVVDGDLEFAGSGGPPGTPQHAITGDGRVTFYVKGDIEVRGNTGVNTGGDAEDLLVLVHSDGGNVATASGTPQFTGLIYAPNASLTINGGGNPWNDNIVGAVVVEDATANGNGNLEYEVPVGFEMEFETTTDITYLHVGENRIDVTAD
ncbi:MAG: collagen-binding domain-containing protein [Haloarculaceae archaeon]